CRGIPPEIETIAHQNRGYVAPDRTMILDTAPFLLLRRAPVRRECTALRKNSTEESISSSGMKEPATILLVDDDEMAREVIGNLLRRAISTARVVAVEHGEAGLRFYQEANPELVITDMKMVGMSGAELIQAIRETDQLTPIIVVSGAPEVVPVVGATEVFQKVDFRRLIERARELIEGPAPAACASPRAPA
ncbi:MAG TPA: response regulator, partial [Opitutus sp.]|nr:response regulator [Opitutus sp.]